MIVKIITGTYGYRKNGLLMPKHKGDVVTLDDAEAKRLIELKIAVKASELPTKSPIHGHVDDSANTNIPDSENGQEDAGNGDDEAVDLEEMTVPELKELAKEFGVKNAAKMKRQELIDAITSNGTAALPEG